MPTFPTLEDMYGPDAFDQLAETLRDVTKVKDAEISERFESGGVEIVCRWKNEALRIAFTPTRAHYVLLTTTCARDPKARETGAATYQRLCAAMEKLLTAWGVGEMTAAVYDDAAVKTLMRHAPFKRDGNLLIWRLES